MYQHFTVFILNSISVGAEGLRDVQHIRPAVVFLGEVDVGDYAYQAQDTQAKDYTQDDFWALWPLFEDAVHQDGQWPAK